MKIETAKALVAQAAAINGFVPMLAAEGTLEVREIKGVAENGAWITNVPTRSLMGYVRIARKGQPTFIARAKDIIARKDEILAARHADARRALDLD